MNSPAPCIYCDGPGPFNAEHVVPASLGGDDRAWILRGLVCVECNSTVFSAFEAIATRQSPLALGRIFLQPTGRREGGKTEPPSFNARTIQVIAADSGLAVEAELVAPGTQHVLPQIVGIQRTLHFTGGHDGVQGDVFRCALPRVLIDRVQLVEKVTKGDRKEFKVAELAWNGASYDSGSMRVVDTAPKDCLWREELAALATLEAGTKIGPRLYRRRAGQFVVRTTTLDQAAMFLSAIRADVAQFADASQGPTQAVGRGAHIRVLDPPGGMKAYYRLIQKTGMNLVIQLLGERIGRSPSFDAVKGSLFKGKPLMPRAKGIAKWILGLDLQLAGPEEHALKLTTIRCLGTRYLFFLVRWYGGPIECVMLGRFSESELKAVTQRVVVNYVQNKITQRTFSELLRQRLARRFRILARG